MQSPQHGENHLPRGPWSRLLPAPPPSGQDDGTCCPRPGPPHKGLPLRGAASAVAPGPAGQLRAEACGPLILRLRAARGQAHLVLLDAPVRAQIAQVPTSPLARQKHHLPSAGLGFLTRGKVPTQPAQGRAPRKPCAEVTATAQSPSISPARPASLSHSPPSHTDLPQEGPAAGEPCSTPAPLDRARAEGPPTLPSAA